MNQVFAKTPNRRGTLIEKNYYRWLHQNAACCLTGYTPFEIAHTGGLSEGKGTGRKSNLETCLPLRLELHRHEEQGREKFWQLAGFPDHLAWAERLFDIFEANDDPTTLLWDMQERANRAFLMECMK